MFAYGILSALKHGIVDDRIYNAAVEKAYDSLYKHSTESAKNGLTCTNVCTGTCIGDKNYYLKRGVQKGRPFGLGMFVQFGMLYEYEKRPEVTSEISVIDYKCVKTCSYWNPFDVFQSR